MNLVQKMMRGASLYGGFFIWQHFNLHNRRSSQTMISESTPEPLSVFHYRISFCLVFIGLNITSIQYRFLVLFLVYREFSRFLDSSDVIMYCRWQDISSHFMSCNKMFPWNHQFVVIVFLQTGEPLPNIALFFILFIFYIF